MTTDDEVDEIRVIQVISGNAMVWILGKNEFNRHILSNFLHKHTNLPCRHLDCCNFDRQPDGSSKKTNVIFYDYSCLQGIRAKDYVGLDRIIHSDNSKVLFYRVDPDKVNEFALIRKGVKGVLYISQPINLFPKAVRAVLKGELFYPRHILEQVFLSNQTSLSIPNDKCYVLTARQKGILMLMTAGKSNQEIAHHLGLSPCTVKSHIYTIYKRLDVRSRSQAIKSVSQWYHRL